MIDDLDRSLEALLRHDLPPSLVAQVSISFAAPDDRFPPASVALPAIDLFLYNVQENRDLRSNERIIDRPGNGVVVLRQPPVRVECSYLVTAWPSEGSTTPALDEHRLLGEVMKVLLRHPVLPDEVLRGSLVGQEPALRATALQAGSLQSLGEFWQALGGKPKATLNYTVTISVDPFEGIEVPEVVERVLRSGARRGNG
jgi:hypothetical protein